MWDLMHWDEFVVLFLSLWGFPVLLVSSLDPVNDYPRSQRQQEESLPHDHKIEETFSCSPPQKAAHFRKRPFHVIINFPLWEPCLQGNFCCMHHYLQWPTSHISSSQGLMIAYSIDFWPKLKVFFQLIIDSDKMMPINYSNVNIISLIFRLYSNRAAGSLKEQFNIFTLLSSPWLMKSQPVASYLNLAYRLEKGGNCLPCGKLLAWLCEKSKSSYQHLLRHVSTFYLSCWIFLLCFTGHCVLFLGRKQRLPQVSAGRLTTSATTALKWIRERHSTSAFPDQKQMTERGWAHVHLEIYVDLRVHVARLTPTCTHGYIL